MIIDAHQHFWDMTRFVYPWLKPELKSLYRNFLPQDLRPLIESNGVEKTVVVQAISSVEETRWLLRLSDENDFIAAVVGWVDLQDKNVEETLGELTKHPRLKALRHQVEEENDREWLLRESVQKGLKSIEKHGLRFDALLKHDQLWQLERVVERCPGLKIVIDHASKPNIKEREFDTWAVNLEKVARLPVYCKFSGLFTEADHAGWAQKDIRPYAERISSTFGTERVMFGSDWPVSTMASDYSRTLEVSRELLGGLSEADLKKVFHSNAKTFYKFDF